MEKTRFEKKNTPIVLALGFFDCVHLGHRKVISRCKELAKKLNVASAVFTFSNDINKIGGKQIYTFSEREKLLKDEAVDFVISCPFDEKIKNTSPNSFIDMLFESYDIRSIVCGADYRFGKNAEGNVELLKSICEEKGVNLIVVDEVLIDKKRVSTTEIKEFLQKGEIEKANVLLVEPYFIIGSVIHGRGEGKTFGIPTANISVNEDKTLPKSGVYACALFVDGVEYKAVTNVGEKPTVGDYSFTIEALIGNGFNGDLYGKTVTIKFCKYLRDTKKFENPKVLADTVLSDLKKWENSLC
jgi:riboflavin kinase/FMN adenylyltransferase